MRNWIALDISIKNIFNNFKEIGVVFASSLPYSTVLFAFIQVIACLHRDQFAHGGKNNQCIV